MSFLILCTVLLCGFETLQLSRRDTCDTDIFSNAAVSSRVKSRSMRKLLNFFNNPFISSLPMVMDILKVEIHHVKHYLLFFSIFLFFEYEVGQLFFYDKWEKAPAPMPKWSDRILAKKDSKSAWDLTQHSSFSLNRFQGSVSPSFSHQG